MWIKNYLALVKNGNIINAMEMSLKERKTIMRLAFDKINEV